jgi:DNA-binding response OmpR family regulator
VPILLVEDEPSERLAIEGALSKAGHRVIVETDGRRAMDLIETIDYALAALITAVELHQDCSGWELARVARRLSPAIPVIYLTRFSEAAWGVHGVTGSRLFIKPTDPSQITSSVRALLKHGCGGLRA